MSKKETIDLEHLISEIKKILASLSTGSVSTYLLALFQHTNEL